jgi:hypothetical protein
MLLRTLNCNESTNSDVMGICVHKFFWFFFLKENRMKNSANNFLQRFNVYTVVSFNAHRSLKNLSNSEKDN